jgi:hypothetical protein
MVREDEKKLKQWTSGSDPNNLIERGWIKSKKMKKVYRSKQSHREREVESNAKEWTCSSDLNNLIEGGWTESKRM